MKISIDIDNDNLSALVNKGIEEIDRDTLGKVVNATMEKIFTDTEMVKGMLFDKNVGYSGTPYYGAAKEWVTKMIVESVTPEDLAAFKKKIFEIVESDGHNLILKTLATVLTNSLFSYENQGEFMRNVMNSIEGARR